MIVVGQPILQQLRGVGFFGLVSKQVLRQFLRQPRFGKVVQVSTLPNRFGSRVPGEYFCFLPTNPMKSSSRFSSPAYNLLPADIIGNIPALGATSDNPDPTFHVKIFTPDSSLTWFVAEYDPESKIGYGFVIGPFPEWGTFSFDEIRKLRGSLGLPVERDLHFSPCPSSKITKDHY